MVEGDLVLHLARFSGALRKRGIAVTLKDELDATRAMPLVDLLDRREVQRALEVTLKIRPRDRAVFEEEFARLWSAAPTDPPESEPPSQPNPADRRGPPRWVWDGRRVQLGASQESPDHPEGDTPGYSPEAVLRRRPFEECTAADLAAMERLLAMAVARLATRQSRRYVPVRRGGKVDLRRSFRRAVASEGDLYPLARRDRSLKDVDLVLLCDTSGSMDPYTRFLLTLLLAVRRVVRRTEVFVFNTGLTRITRMIAPGRLAATLDRLAKEVPDWSGGTRIGDSLAEFVTVHQNQVVTGKTVVVIVSDGLDTGETVRLVGAMRAISTRARAVIWLNPLLGDSRYQPTARGMQAALPFVDHFAPAHTLDALEKLLPILANS